MEEKLIYENSNEILVLQVCEILKENEIPFIRREEGAGAYFNVTWGSNIGIKRIYVSSEDYDKAKNLIEIFNENIQIQEDDEIPEELKEVDETDEHMEKEINKYKNMNRILRVWIPLGMFMTLLIAGAILILSDL